MAAEKLFPTPVLLLDVVKELAEMNTVIHVRRRRCFLPQERDARAHTTSLRGAKRNLQLSGFFFHANC